MRKFSTQLLLLAAISSLLGEPSSHLQKATFSSQQEFDYPFSYDGIMKFLHDVQSGELEKRCTPEDLEKIAQFLVFLARAGVLPEDTEENRSLEGDIEELLDREADSYDYMVIPALSRSYGEILFCKHKERSWAEKKWDQITKFAKKHEKALIVGSVVVVGAAVVVVAVVATSASAGTAAASAIGAVASSGSDNPKSRKQKRREASHHSNPTPQLPPEAEAPQEAPSLKAVIDQQVISFKEQVVQEQFFDPPHPFSQQQLLSWEENGRALGSLFAHESLKKIEQQIFDSPRLSQEVQAIGLQYDFSAPTEYGLTQLDFGHPKIDSIFSTDYGSLFITSGSNLELDFQTLSYQVRGEQALACGYYDQAVHDLGRAIELNPTNPLPYLERGVAHLGLGQYDLLLEDYHTFSSQAQKNYPLSIPDFGRGFAKGLPRGIYDSGEGIFLLVSDLVRHPIHTGGQMWHALTLLSELARSEEWSALCEVLAPEIHLLVKEWDTLPSNVRGELAGYAFGKYGADIIIPGALAKAVSRGLKGAQKISTVYRGLQTAEQTLILESVATLESSAKIAEVIEASKSTLILGEELGLSTREMGQLKQAGQLEGAVATTCERIAQDTAMLESFELFTKAQDFLKPYNKSFMPEAECRELIHQTGIQTFPRPEGIPENFRATISDKGAGMLYVHPEHTHTSIRIMPGKPHSSFPYQQSPYVIFKKDGKTLDKFGNIVDKGAPEAHIPLEEFRYAAFR